eukprot:GHUV01039517.1.p2 GENE.GHUV01039517.1~~GHUV01039517.1.p2  ORF type:complete len:106 (-),score=19.06 GHUV01039517.1:50-367(-)
MKHTPDIAKPMRQLFVTASPTLKDQVAKQFRKLQVRQPRHTNPALPLCWQSNILQYMVGLDGSVPCIRTKPAYRIMAPLAPHDGTMGTSSVKRAVICFAGRCAQS